MLASIKNTLLDLKPTGEDGFEGLVGEIILGITGIHSRLAKSGTQFGVDGDSIFQADAICFEAKLYRTKLNKNEVVTKVAELGIYKDAADILWVLGSTSPLATQDASLLTKRGAKDGISVLILDWNNSGLSIEAHRRCCWTKHWAHEMIHAQSVEEFWCASLLLAKISDRRLELFLDSQADYGLYWPQYNKAISQKIKSRVKKWETKRKETYLGIKSINKVFLDVS